MTPTEELAAVRNAIREGHELLRDLRNATREAKEFADKMNRTYVTERIDAEVSKGLDEYREVLDKAIDAATTATYNRFDLLASICLGEDYESQKMGAEPVPELIRRYLRTHPEILLELNSVKAKGAS